MDRHKLAQYGWAPGQYQGICRSCSGKVHGAKRCIRCYACAEEMFDRGVNLQVATYGPDLRKDTIGSLLRQRDELHETTNRYLERARKAEYALAKALKDLDNAI